jgi:hypothetical protein
MIDIEQKNQDEFGVVVGGKGGQRQYMVTLGHSGLEPEPPVLSG